MDLLHRLELEVRRVALTGTAVGGTPSRESLRRIPTPTIRGVDRVAATPSNGVAAFVRPDPRVPRTWVIRGPAVNTWRYVMSVMTRRQVLTAGFVSGAAVLTVASQSGGAGQ